MRAAFTRHQVPKNRILIGCALLNPVGLAGLMLTGAFGFEAPNSLLLLLSVAFIAAAPAAVAVHLAATRMLSGQEKKLWIRLLTGVHAPQALLAYLSSGGRGQEARRLAEELRDPPSKHRDE